MPDVVAVWLPVAISQLQAKLHDPIRLKRLILALTYTALVIAGAPIAWGAGRGIEVSYPDSVALSTFVFMGVLTLVLLLAGPIAFRLTPDDPVPSDPVAQRTTE